MCDAPPCLPQASRYHGLDDERLHSDGLPIATVLQHMLDAMRLALDAKGRLVSHNLEFDAGTLLEEYRRSSLEETTGRLNTPNSHTLACALGFTAHPPNEPYFWIPVLTAPLNDCTVASALALLDQLARGGACTIAIIRELQAPPIVEFPPLT